MSKQVTQDTTALKNYAGTHSRDLIGQLLNGLDIAGDIKVLRNVKAPLHLTKLIVNGGIRPVDTAVNKADKPGRKWSKRTLTPKVGMKIFEVIPEELRDTWMSEMLDPNAKDVPFADWVWEQEFNKVKEEINENVFYSEFHGDAEDFDEAATYAIGDVAIFGESRNIYKCIAATTAGQSPTTNAAKWEKINARAICDGLGTIIKREISAGKIVPVATGIIDSTNAVAKLKQIYLEAPSVVRKKKTVMLVSVDVMQAYKDDYDARYGKGNGIADSTEDQDVIYLKGSGKRCQLKEATWLGDSSRVIHTLPDNLLMGTNMLDKETNGLGKIIENLHGFDAIIKFILGFEIADLEALWVNDQV